MSRSLGAFGKTRPPLDMTFDWFDNVIRVEPNATDTVLLDFLSKAVGIEDEAGPEAMKAVEDFLAALIHHEDFPTFMHIGRAHRQTIEDLMSVAYAVLEAVTARPTPRPADSSGGPSTTPAASTEKSSVVAVVEDLERRHRPDLANAIMQAQRHLSAAQS